jgi:hypothetical protein
VSTIPPSINNSVFEETKAALREWLYATKRIEILEHASFGGKHSQYSVLDLENRVQNEFNEPRFTHVSYAACVKFALEYERDSEQHD